MQCGLPGGIFKSLEWQWAIASRADLLFSEGSPSCSYSQVNPLPDLSNIVTKCWSIKDLKYCASIFSYLSQVSTPLPWLIATIILATFPQCFQEPMPRVRESAFSFYRTNVYCSRALCLSQLLCDGPLQWKPYNVPQSQLMWDLW